MRHLKHSLNFEAFENIQSLNIVEFLSKTITKLESREFLPNRDFTFRFRKHIICITDQCHLMILLILFQCNTRALGVHIPLPRWIHSESESQIHSTQYGNSLDPDGFQKLT